MRIKVVTKGLAFPIRIVLPYGLLTLFASKTVLKALLKNVAEAEEIIDQLDSRVIKETVKQFKEFKGTELVSFKTKDGTELKIIL
ncbi:hypothetical protein SAMN05421736_11816 [Evansella caseinilytica]|uniref:Uncharacterized protein n=1 Tax=Evansella caseinilytica TaxID=1503961 RepID=A0A1H3U3F3_9BACI|nr:hypothetical protein [Evansella caseinilytica]SDZ56868.1 hypothetical protein SAMN05421736_11816 [Evansella caseinilytica]